MDKKENNNAEAWFELGLANERLKDLNAAETAYRRSIMLDDQNTDALLRLGFIAKSKDDKKEIKAIQEKFLKLILNFLKIIISSLDALRLANRLKVYFNSSSFCVK